MKLHHIAAATLLIGTSALAWAPKTDPALDSTAAQSAPAAAGDPNLDLAVKPDAVVPEADVPEATAPKAAEPDPAFPEATHPEAADIGTADTGPDGVGGPVETAETMAVTSAAIDLAPHPATQNYPPCAPGPGDDNCIQLYEPGVRMALAGWNQPTGGLTDGQTAAATAMGGPYEPAEVGSAETAMSGDGVVDPAMGETEGVELSGI